MPNIEVSNARHALAIATNATHVGTLAGMTNPAPGSVLRTLQGAARAAYGLADSPDEREIARMCGYPQEAS